MTNYEIVKTFLELQKNTVFAELTPLDFGILNYSALEPSSYWNYVLTDAILTDDQIAVGEKKLQSLDRKPMFYFESKPDLEPLKNKLTEKGYKFFSEDSWMFYDNSIPVDTGRFSSVRRVETPEDLDVWVKTMDKCYVTDDKQNPYGPLGEAYIALAQKAWKENHATGEYEYFTAFKDDKPVAVVTLTYQNNLGYISNIGSLPSVRGEGYGKLITLYCVNESQKAKTEGSFLATEEGTYPNAFYKKIGFKTKFTGMGLNKE